MNIRALLRWLCETLSNYNLFIPEENQDNNDHQEIRDVSTMTKYQKYSTRLYLLLLISEYLSKLYEIRTLTIILMNYQRKR
jgi:uncharacterized membrane protein